MMQTLSRQCSDREGWCQAGNPVPGLAAEIMAGQLAESLFGQMSFFRSSHSSADVAAAAEMPDVKRLEGSYLRQGIGDKN
jgi:hypothetical protein